MAGKSYKSTMPSCSAPSALPTAPTRFRGMAACCRFGAVRGDYPDVEPGRLRADGAGMDFVRKPEAFDVSVAGNRFGDILTDLSAIFSVGSLGRASSPNNNRERIYPSLFEPVHGSAP